MGELSAILVVRDEAPMIAGCLETLGFCDEIVVVVDDRTTDATEEIARRFTGNVSRLRFEDHAQMRNAAVAQARGDWIVFVDADERVLPDLAAQMRAAVDAGAHVAYWSPTINFFWGRRMDHGGWSPMWQIRLMRREFAHWSGRVHERAPVPVDQAGRLTGELWHFSHRSIDEGLRKVLHYGALEARDAYERGAPPVRARSLVKVMALEFGQRFVRRAGWRDGMPGWTEALFQPLARMCAQVMLWELQQDGAIERSYAELERRVRDAYASSRT